MKEDLTKYTDSELSLRVFNIEELYKIRHLEGLKEEIQKRYKYTKEQEKELNTDLQNDRDELEEWVKGQDPEELKF